VTDSLGDLPADLEQHRARFLSEVAGIRPQLHRFCSRMSGSVLDGEDLVQEVLIQAFYKLPSLKDPSRLKPWLFRIAHNRCIDRMRRRGGVDVELREDDAATGIADDPETAIRVSEAVAALVTHLPPMERACVVLKDVLDYPLSDIAEITGSSLGGVKAALHRGRAKLRAMEPDSTGVSLPPGERVLVQAYLDRFNARDWDGVRELVRKDARLELVDRVEGNAVEIMKSRYCSNYENLPWTWKLELARVDGEEVIVHFKQVDGAFRPHAAMRLEWQENQVRAVSDYIHIEYLLDGAATVQEDV